MKEKEQSLDQILRLKDAILTGFQALPVEHQASLSLVMLNTVLDGDFGDWIRQVLPVADKPEATSTPFAFPIVTRNDLQFVGFTEQEIAQLSLEDMRTLTVKLFDHYRLDEFPDDLRFLTDEMLEERKGSEETSLDDLTS